MWKWLSGILSYCTHTCQGSTLCEAQTFPVSVLKQRSECSRSSLNLRWGCSSPELCKALGAVMLPAESVCCPPGHCDHNSVVKSCDKFTSGAAFPAVRGGLRAYKNSSPSLYCLAFPSLLKTWKSGAESRSSAVGVVCDRIKLLGLFCTWWWSFPTLVLLVPA